MIKRSDEFPKARTADLVTERVGDELVVYDGASSEAHCLSTLASAVFVAADGRTSTADLAAIASRELNEVVDVPAVEQALVELQECGLVESLEVGGISRRGFMQRSAAVGGAVVAGSLVTSVVTPAYGQAASANSGIFPGGFSSMAVEFYDVNTGKYYGAHWSQSSNGLGAPDPAWNATQANHNCQLVHTSQDGSDGVPPGASSVMASPVHEGLFITVPSNLVVVYVAVFYGNGGGKCPGCTNPTISAKTGNGYTLQFPSSCY